MAEKVKRPKGFCAKCGAAQYDVASIGLQCLRTVAGMRCMGTVESALEENDWSECPSCSATGRVEDEVCYRCGEGGWIPTQFQA